MAFVTSLKRFGCLALLGLSLSFATHVSQAQTTTDTPPAPAPAPAPANPPAATTPPAQATPAPPVTIAPTTPNGPAQAPQPPAAQDDTNKPADDASSVQTINMTEQPMAYVSGSASWDEGYGKLQDGFKQVKAELDKAGLKSIGRPMALFLDTDDKGFRYEAMILLENPPQGKTELTPDVKIGKTPAGKVLKFQHHGAYDEISSTYEAIAAYLDEKDLEAQNLLIEEYANDVSGSDDMNLEVNIYVYVK